MPEKSLEDDHVHDVSYQLGLLNERIKGLGEDIDRIEGNHKIEKQLDAMTRREEAVSREKINETMSKLVNTTDNHTKMIKKLEPFADDYATTKSKFYGVFLAAGAIGALIAWVADKVIEVWKPRL